MSLILPYRGVMPTIHEDAFVAPNASVIGDVRVGADASLWFGAVLRGDVMPIHIGARTSIQDNSVVHATGGWSDTVVGEDCVVGHGVILHGCTVGNRVLVGMGAIVLDFAEIGDDVVLGAGAVVTPRTKIPSGVLALGQPAKPVRDLRDEDRMGILAGVQIYVDKAREYRTALSEG